MVGENLREVGMEVAYELWFEHCRLNGTSVDANGIHRYQENLSELDSRKTECRIHDSEFRWYHGRMSALSDKLKADFLFYLRRKNHAKTLQF